MVGEEALRAVATPFQIRSWREAGTGGVPADILLPLVLAKIRANPGGAWELIAGPERRHLAEFVKLCNVLFHQLQETLPRLATLPEVRSLAPARTAAKPTSRGRRKGRAA